MDSKAAITKEGRRTLTWVAACGTLLVVAAAAHLVSARAETTPAAAQSVPVKTLDEKFPGAAPAAPQPATTVAAEPAAAPAPEHSASTPGTTTGAAVPPVPAENQATSVEFEDAMKSLLPLTPEEISEVLRRTDQKQQALQGLPAPQGEILTLPISLETGSRPQLIRLAPGYATAMTLLDITGKPWPVTSSTVGDPRQFDVVQPGGGKDQGASNIMIAVPKLPYAKSNLVLTLQGANAPLVLQLETGREISYYRADLVIAERGPNSVDVPVASMLQPLENTVMRYLLDGVPPKGAREVEISGGQAKAWIVGNKFYLRTRLSLRHPAYVSIMHGVNDMKLYELPLVAVIATSDENGQMVDLRVAEDALLDGALARKSTTLGAMTFGPEPVAAETEGAEWKYETTPSEELKPTGEPKGPYQLGVTPLGRGKAQGPYDQYPQGQGYPPSGQPVVVVK